MDVVPIAADSNGQASLTITAGPAAGPVQVTATASGQTATFNLTVRPPGPQLTQDSFLNGASFQKGEAGKAAFSFGSIGKSAALVIVLWAITYALSTVFIKNWLKLRAKARGQA